MSSPVPDNQRSPITGWTREHWLRFADAQLEAVRPFATEHFDLINLPGRPSGAGETSDGLEGFARTFLLAAFRAAGDGEEPAGHLERYRMGLLAGTGGSWPAIASYSQPMVEAASIAIGLHLTKAQLWDTLGQAERDQIAAWLSGSSFSEVGKNNWVLFPMVIAEFLAGTGYPHNEERIVQGLAGLEKWYVGGGWYRDGDGDFFDYYCGWAMHLYPVLWLRMLAERDPERAATLRPRFARRLEELLPDLVNFFGGNGSPIYHGRSLIYRYAAVAPLFVAELAGIPSPLTPGQLRRIGSGALQYFAEGTAYLGVSEAPGVPTLGWQGEFLPMVQSYSGPASPFWTSKAFVALLLPADHPVWTAEEESSPVERADRTRVAAGPNFLLASTAADGIARVLNHGSDKYYGPGRETVEYSRLAYSSHTAPLYGSAGTVDNHIGVLDAGGNSSVRMRIHRLASDGDSVASYYRPVWGLDDEAASPWRIATATTTADGYELRVHVVSLGAASLDAATIDGSPRIVREGGYAIAANEPVESSVVEGVAGEVDGAAALTSGLHSLIWPLLGYSSAGTSSAIGLSPLGRHTTVPYLEGAFTGPRSTFASLVRLAGGAVETGPADLMVDDMGNAITVSVTAPGGTVLSVRLNA